MRAVLDPNVLISSVLSRTGSPAESVARWLGGDFELVVSELVLAELERALAYPKLRRRIQAADAEAFVALLRQTAVLAAEPDVVQPRSPDAGDDYLLALAEAERAVVVTGDRQLLELPEQLPIFTPRGFLDSLEAR